MRAEEIALANACQSCIRLQSAYLFVHSIFVMFLVFPGSKGFLVCIALANQDHGYLKLSDGNVQISITDVGFCKYMSAFFARFQAQ